MRTAMAPGALRLAAMAMGSGEVMVPMYVPARSSPERKPPPVSRRMRGTGMRWRS